MLVRTKTKKMKFKFYIILFYISINSFSQQIEVSGLVKDSLGVPIESANVIALLKTDKNKLASYSVTNSKGKYQLTLKTNSSYVLNVSYLGYETISYNLNMIDGQGDIDKDFIYFAGREKSIR